MRHLDLLHRKIGKASHPGDVNVNDVHAEYTKQLGMNGAIAGVLTHIYGSMYFVYLLTFGVAGWMLWQGYFGVHAFDPYPFAFCLFVGNIIQLLGMPILQVGQNQVAIHNELRAESDHLISLDTHERLTSMERDIKELRGLLIRIALEQEYNEQQDAKGS